jgi:hypothetical protein
MTKLLCRAAICLAVGLVAASPATAAAAQIFQNEPVQYRQYPYPDGYGRDRYSSTNVAGENGYRDGVKKGREDSRDHDRYNPNRHGWFKSADRGYNKHLGPKDWYRNEYREAFLSGYAQGYREYRRGW